MTSTHRTTLSLTLVAMAIGALTVSSANADVIASTDFNGRGLAMVNVANDTATNLNWTLNGVADPGNLTAIDVNSTGSLAGLHNNNTLVQNLFGPNLNIQNEGPWSTTVTLSPDPLKVVTLTDVTFDQQNLSNTGVANQGRPVDFTVSVIGSLSGLLDTVVINDSSGPTASLTFILASAIELSPLETYDITIQAATNSGLGNNVGIDNLSINGTVAEAAVPAVPEPASLAIWCMLGLVGAGGALRRRRKLARA